MAQLLHERTGAGGAATATPQLSVEPGEALKVFISYARADMAAADALVEALERNGFQVRIDRRDLPYGEEWQAELSGFIAESDTVAWLVSPDSVRSKWCNWELGEVARLSKRLLPVRARDIDPDALPEALGRIHLLPADGVYEPSRHEAVLVAALNTDRAWLKQGTAFGERAREWLSKDRDAALVLRGRALADAESWSQTRPRGEAPPPASEILDLILASRRAQDRRRRITVAGSVAAAVVALALAWFGFDRAAEAEAQRQAAVEQQAEAERQRAVAEENERKAAEQEAEATRQAEIAGLRAEEARTAQQRAEAERSAALKAEVDRVTAISEPYLRSGRPDIALALSLDVAPRDAASGVPLTSQMESVIRRAYLHTPAPVARRLLDNAYTVVASADGRSIAAGTAGENADTKGSVHIFDPATKAERVRFKAMDDVISGLDFSPDGTSLAVAGGKTPGVWNAFTGEPKFALSMEGTWGFSTQVRFSPDGRFIVLGTNGNRAFIYDATDGELRFTLSGMEFDDIVERLEARGIVQDDPIVHAVAEATWKMFGTTTYVAISPDGKLVALAGSTAADGSVQLFDAETGQLARILTGGTTSFFLAPATFNISRLDFSPDGKTVVASPLQNTIKVWDAASGALRAELPARDIQSFVVSEDGQMLISGHANGNVAFRCLGGLLETAVLRGHDEGVSNLAASFPMRLLATMSQDRTAKLWRLPSSTEVCARPDMGASNIDAIAAMTPLAVFAGHESIVQAGSFTADGRTLLTVSRDGHLRFWDIDDSPEPIDVAPDFGPYFSAYQGRELLYVSGDGRTVFVRDSEYRDLIAYDIATRERTDLEHASAVAPEAGDGRGHLFAGPRDYWAPGETNPPLAQEVRYSSWHGPVSPDGRRAIREEDDRFFLFDTEREIDVVELTQASLKVGEFFFSPDSSRLFGRLLQDDFQANDVLVAWDAIRGRELMRSDEMQSLSISAKREMSLDGTRLLLSDGTETALYDLAGDAPMRVEVPGLGEGDIGGENPVDLADDGSIFVRGRLDGRLELFHAGGNASARTLRPTTSAITRLALSEDATRVALVDLAGTVTLHSLPDDRTIKRYMLGGGVAAMAYSSRAGRLVVLDLKGDLHLLPLTTASDTLVDGLSFVQWLRATRHSAVTYLDREQYGLRPLGQETQPDLRAIEPFPVPPRRANPAPNDAASACDGLATNPFDRDRRADGVALQAIDPDLALQVCEEALRSAPDDPQTIYHMGRVFERRGDLDAAMTHYLRAAGVGYAIGLRSVGRLLAVAEPGRFGDLGGADAWRERAAAAGDPWGLVDVAILRGVSLPPAEGFQAALSMLESAGLANRAQAMMELGFWMHNYSDLPATRERALLASTIGLELYERVAGMSPVPNHRLVQNTYGFVREASRNYTPQRLVALYREALDWMAAMGRGGRTP